MGGCRCTYKNCTLRTDGITHMFHYPVFDKVRCHQWLINAQKQEFFDLKLSQLKNRVVCQHHFKDDNFMNFLKDKLTFEAVPTLDGPYCDSSQLAGNKPVQEDSKLYSISLEDIENEYLTFNDKKANFSVKYGDFLTNCDLMDLDSMNLTNDNTQIIMKEKSLEEQDNTILNDNIDHITVPNANPILNKTLDTLQSNNNNVLTVHVSEVPITIEGDKAEMTIPNVNLVPPPTVPQTTDQTVNISVFTHKPSIKKKNPRSLLNDTKKITIINERSIPKNLPAPVQFPIKLEPVSPSAILTLPNKRRNLDMNLRSRHNNMQTNSTKPIGNDTKQINIISEQCINLESEVNNVQAVIASEDQSNIRNVELSRCENQEIDVKPINVPINVSPQKVQSSVVNKINPKKNNNSLIKNRIAPERMAAIEEKRKFNMKLRDIIASCLDKLDDEDSKDLDNCKTKIKKKLTQNISTYLSKEPELPGIQDYTVAYLEARMKRMENILLNKIDQNSQRIMDLKQLFTPKPDKKVGQTQTVLNEELQKKHLYQEISKFLSPEANSLVYEELFINKYTQKIGQKSTTKKRKYR